MSSSSSYPNSNQNQNQNAIHSQPATYELEHLQLSRSQSSSQSTEANPNPASNTAARSRASSLVSSVFSTGTRFSVTTLPQGWYQVDGVLEQPGSASGYGGGGGGGSGMGMGREGSIYGYSDSIRSTSTSLPPYEVEVGGGDGSGMIAHGYGHGHGYSPSHPHPHQGFPTSPTTEQAPITPTSISRAMIDPENLISRHYGAVVRTIDTNHQHLLARTIQAHEREMAEMRDGIDKVYRREFREREREVERVREMAAAERRTLEEGMEREREEWGRKVEVLEREVREKEEEVEALGRGFEMGVERACHAVEDVWERRWEDRMRLAEEEGVRRVRRRDEEWVGVLGREFPEVLEGVRRAMGLGG